jgi:hypothetical protein
VEEHQWPIWQIAILILVIVGAIVYVALGVLGIGPGAAQPEVAAQASPTLPAAWPTAQTKTPTPTSTPTATPGPTPTPTSTPTPTHTPTLTPTPTSTPIIVQPQINALGRLETAKYVMQVIIDLKREPNNIWQKAFGTDKLLLIAEGEVVMGFDLTKVEANDIIVQGTSVSLTLPPPEILNQGVVNENKTYVYVRETGLFVPPDPGLETEARRLAQKAIINWAVEHGAYDKAKEFGTLYLESFLRSLGFTEIKVQVRENVSAGRPK